MLEMTAEDANRFERKRKKKNPDQGFSGSYLTLKTVNGLNPRVSVVCVV